MARAQQDIVQTMYQIVAAGLGIDLESGGSETMPYDPAILAGIAQSGKDVK